MRREAMGQGAFAERLHRMMVVRTRAFYEIARDGTHGAEVMHFACPEAHEAKARFFGRQRELIHDFFEQGRDLGCFEIQDPLATTHAWLHAHQSFAPPLLFQQSEEQALRSLKDLDDLLLQGLLPRSESQEC